MENKTNFTEDDICIIYDALISDACKYRDIAVEEIENKKVFQIYMEDYRKRLILAKRIGDLYDDNESNKDAK